MIPKILTLVFILILPCGLALEYDEYLDSLIQDFFREPIEEVVTKHYQTDPGFRAAMAFLNDEKQRTLVGSIKALPEVSDMHDIFGKNGLDLTGVTGCLTNLIVTMPVEPTDATPDLTSFVADLRKVLLEKIKHMDTAMKESSFLNQLCKTMDKPQFQNALEKFYNSEPVQEYKQILKDIGYDLSDLLNWVTDFFDWGFLN